MAIRVGITGHRMLDDPSAWPWVEDMIMGEIDRFASPVTALTSLAIGADQLLARLVLKRGGQVFAILPFTDYERTFREEDLHGYRELLGNATVEVVAKRGDDEDQYLAAGRRVVDLADLLLAVWNGLGANGKGGTADVVSYALVRRVPLVHINPVTRLVERRQG